MFTKFIENFLTEDECDTIISLGESIDLIEMKSSLIVNGKIIEQNKKYEGNVRVGGYFINESLQIPILENLSNKIINLSNELTLFNGIIFNKIEKYSFNRYSQGDFLDWHSDKHEILNGATITFIIQLNDNYENGDVKYKLDDGNEYKIIKKRGSVFIFDSNILHCVDKITDGVRYSINVWPSKTIKKSII